MRLNSCAGQIVLRENDACGPTARTRKDLQRIVPTGGLAQIYAGEVVRRSVQVGAPRQVALDVTDQPLGMKRRAAWVIASHTFEDLQKFASVMRRAHDTLQRVATVATKQYSFLVVRARHTGEPFRIGELRCDILSGT